MDSKSRLTSPKQKKRKKKTPKKENLCSPRIVMPSIDPDGVTEALQRPIPLLASDVLMSGQSVSVSEVWVKLEGTIKALQCSLMLAVERERIPGSTPRLRGEARKRQGVAG
jgi:hypothetical protein